jgi:hypothetical protein
VVRFYFFLCISLSSFSSVECNDKMNYDPLRCGDNGIVPVAVFFILYILVYRFNGLMNSRANYIVKSVIFALLAALILCFIDVNCLFVFVFYCVSGF